MSDAENSAPETPEDSKKSVSRDDSGENDESQDVNGEKSDNKQPNKKENKGNQKKKTAKKTATHKKESSSDDEEDDEKPAKKAQTEQNASKKDKKVADEEEDEDEDDEDEDEKDKKVALLDQPLEVSGSRERKKVERLALSFNLPSKEKKADIPEGEGTKLADCPRIEFNIRKGKIDDLKALHKVIFNRPGTSSAIRKNILMFSGFTFKRSSQDFSKKKTSLDRLNLSMLKKLCKVLDVEQSKGREDMVNKLMEFLMKPSPSGKKPPQSKRKSTTRSGKKGTKKKRTARSRKNLDKDDSKSDSDSEEAELDDDTEDEVDEEDEEEEEEEEVESEEGEEAVATTVVSEKESEESGDNKKAKGKKPVSGKTPRKETKAKAEAKKEEKPAATAKQQQPKRKNVDSEGDDSSDDEPLAKKSKQPPSDEEIKTLIKKILDGANLEEITMKTVCKQVYATYPEFDLSERKNFIKDTVKSIIS